MLELVLWDGAAQEALQRAQAMGAAMETVHAVESWRCLLRGMLIKTPVGFGRDGQWARRVVLVFVNLLVHLQVFIGHGQANAGGVVACAGEVECLEPL